MRRVAWFSRTLGRVLPDSLRYMPMALKARGRAMPDPGPRPLGRGGVISPWNYPLYLAVGDVLPALLAGNGVVSKADSQTPLTLLWARDVMAEAGLPAGGWWRRPRAGR